MSKNKDKKSIYDYITVTDSKEKTEITFAFSKAQKDVRMKRLAHYKQNERFVETDTTTSGEMLLKELTSAEYNFEYGTAIGELMSSGFISCDLGE